MKGWSRPLSERTALQWDSGLPGSQLQNQTTPLSTPIFGQPSRKDPNGNTLSLGSLGEARTNKVQSHLRMLSRSRQERQRPQTTARLTPHHYANSQETFQGQTHYFPLSETRLEATQQVHLGGGGMREQNALAKSLLGNMTGVRGCPSPGLRG